MSGPPIAKSCAPCHHLELRQLGEAIDERFRNAVAEIIDFGIVAHVLEGKYRQGVDAPAGSVDGRGEKQDAEYNENRGCGRDTPDVFLFGRCRHRRARAAYRPHRSAAVAFQTLEVNDQILGALITMISVLLQGLHDDALEIVRYVGIQATNRNRAAVQDQVVGHSRGRALKRNGARRHLVQHHAQREEVGAGIDGLSAHLFGRHINDGARGGVR